MTVLWIALFWLVLYGAKHWFKKAKPLLPLAQGRKPIVEVEVAHLHLRVKTHVLNGYHDGLCKDLSSEKCRLLKRTLLQLYNLGAAMAVIGMATVLVLLWWTTADLFTKTQSSGTSNTPAKRDLERDPSSISTPDNGAFTVTPIIPGMTVPLSHLPIILLALCICQIVHEGGHAMAAALRRIPILFSGVSITIVFPSAFVVFPTARLEGLPSIDYLRILGAGCFHNFLCWCLLYLVTWAKIGTFFSKLMFEDISSLGKVVVDVDVNSPLRDHIPPGSIITRLDDTMLNVVGDEPKGDPWDAFLLAPVAPVVSQGWCLENSMLENVSTSLGCPSMSGHFCFIRMEGQSDQYGFDPIPILTGSPARCDASGGCIPSSSCMALQRGQQLVRITLLDLSHDGEEEVVLWSGPREEIWEQVQVSTLKSRIPFVSSQLLFYGLDFLEYLKLINLSLYLVNMLPVPALDGFNFLAVLLDLTFHQTHHPSVIDVEALSDHVRHGSPLQRIIKATLSIGTVVSIALCVLLGTIKHVLH
ncbi:hypothetical protein V8B97DRAFT_2054053 [Scleroderma yunnanense]